MTISDAQKGFAESLAAALENAGLHQRLHLALRARGGLHLARGARASRTPLTALQLTAQDLVRKAPNEVVQRLGQSIIKQSKRLERLSALMLDATRASELRFPCVPAPTDLSAIARDVTAIVRPVLQQAGCEIILRADEPVVGEWDATQLDEMMSCLIDNAAKFGAGKPVEVTVLREADTATLSVRDHGPGIPPDRVPHIFEAFERAVSDSHYGGLGLGLFVARAILDGHGGNLILDNRPGDGATFIARLPLHP